MRSAPALLAGVLILLFAAGTLQADVRQFIATSDSRMSIPENWSPVGVPQPGETLFFPGSSSKTITNDLNPNFQFGPLTFESTRTLYGNPWLLTGDVTLGTRCETLKGPATLRVVNSLTFHQFGFNESPLEVAGGAVLTLDAAANGTWRPRRAS